MPLVITVSVYVAARFSLKKIHRNKTSLSNSRRAFLYLDGTYGLYIQALYVLCIFLVTRVIQSETIPGEFPNYRALRESSGLYAISSIVIVLLSFVYIFFIQKKINKKLFVSNGYTDRYQWFWSKKPDNYPPRARLNFALLLLLPAIGIILEIIAGLISRLFAYSIASMF